MRWGGPAVEVGDLHGQLELGIRRIRNRKRATGVLSRLRALPSTETGFPMANGKDLDDGLRRIATWRSLLRPPRGRAGGGRPRRAPNHRRATTRLVRGRRPGATVQVILPRVLALIGHCLGWLYPKPTARTAKAEAGLWSRCPRPGPSPHRNRHGRDGAAW